MATTITKKSQDKNKRDILRPQWPLLLVDYRLLHVFVDLFLCHVFVLDFHLFDGSVAFSGHCIGD